MGVKLFANGKVNPLGLDFGDIRLSVKTELNSAVEKITFQLFYSKAQADCGDAFLVVDSRDYQITVGSAKFSKYQQIFWRAELFTKAEKITSDLAFFEMGCAFKNTDETWIENPGFKYKVSEFQKKFTLNSLPEKARLYIVGLGYYKSQINGKDTDDFFFKPLLTDFDYRLDINNVDYDEKNFYNDKKNIALDTYDVKNLLSVGENTLSVLLGTGWYCNDDKLNTDPCDRFGMPKLFFQLHLIDGDKVTVIESDESVLVRSLNRSSQLFRGDKEDFTLDKENFINAKICSAPSGALLEPMCPHDKIIETLFPISKTCENGVIEYDFGKNHSGSISAKVKGQRGSKIVFQYYEVKDENGLNPYSSEWIAYDVTCQPVTPVEVVYQRDEYVLSGGVDEIYPLFHFNCYRYVTVKCESGFEILDLKSLFISTGIERDGYFDCSEKVIADFYSAYVLTQRDNMHSGIPSDCPHREKLPYTGDGQLACESALYTFDSEEFYRKWLDDIIRSQGNNGWVPYSAPNIGGAGGYWWSNAMTVVPLKLYKFTGDKGVIKKAFEPCLKYIDYCNSVHDGDFVLKRSCIRWYLGEWLNPSETKVDVNYFNTLAFYTAVSQVIEMCEILGENAQKERLLILKQNISDSINANFYNKKEKHYASGVQAESLLPIINGIAPENERQAIFDKLVDGYKKDTHFDTGIVLTPVLLDALTENGQEKLAYQLFTADTAPSFKAMLDGETTLCEHWNKCWPGKEDCESGEMAGVDVSHCHPMFGSVVSWMYKHVAGLDLTELYLNQVTIRPRFIDFIESASAQKQTKYGKVSVLYSAKNDFSMQIEVPFGLTATVILPEKYLKGKVLCGSEYTAEKVEKGCKKIIFFGGNLTIKQN